MMRYFFIILTLAFAVNFASGTFVHALDLGGKTLTKTAATQAGYDPDTDERTLAEIIGTIVKAVLSLAGVIFTFLIAYAGDMWMAARGNQESIDKAKKIIIGSIIGLIVSLAAYTLSNFAVNAVLDRATGQGEIVPATPVGGPLQNP